MTSLRMPTGLLTLILCLLLSSPCIAMKPAYESLDHVLARTRTAIVADIGSVEETEGPRFYRLLTFTATPVETLFGKNFATHRIACRYLEGLVHRRGDTMVAPLISGSGMEFNIKAGDRVVLLIAADANEQGEYSVLRIEPLDRRDAIEQFGATRSRDGEKQ
jgi:hypothetical protein